MEVYDVEFEPADPEGFAAVVPALPGLLVLGPDVDEVLRRVRMAIAFHDGCGLLPIRLAVRRHKSGEHVREQPALSRREHDLARS